MQKLLFILKKEFLLLFRDIPGLIILFMMPILLIFVVTLAQENALKSQNSKTKVVYADESNSSFSKKLLANLDSSGIFEPVKSLRGKPVTATSARALIASGEYRFGVVVGPGDSSITLLLDPTLQESYRKSVGNALTYVIKGTQTREAMNAILATMPGSMQPVIEGMIARSLQKLPPVVETFATKELSTIQPNVIQNNVPGFILFAMFFIVIPLAGSLITEKNEGSFQRLRSLPVSLSLFLGGKALTYIVVCLIQFLLMMIIGTWVFPTFFGLPQLQTGHQYLAIAVATVAASMAAIGFGCMVGAAASTHGQAALFGSVIVVLLGVISGTFMPIHIMPSYIRFISHFSPIRWGIDNYLNLFIREGNLASIIPGTILLILFFGFAMTVSLVTFAKRQ
ncbi:MAG: ABC transporter permease [Bacteroidota bacterium]